MRFVASRASFAKATEVWLCRLVFVQPRHPSRVEQCIRLVGRIERALLVQPADDRDDALARLRADEATALAHGGDDGGRLQDACGQLALAEAMLAVQVLADQVAEWMAHVFPDLDPKV